jgi:hypothetical protein
VIDSKRGFLFIEARKNDYLLTQVRQSNTRIGRDLHSSSTGFRAMGTEGALLRVESMIDLDPRTKIGEKSRIRGRSKTPSDTGTFRAFRFRLTGSQSCDTVCIAVKTHSTQQAAKLAGVSYITLRRWLADGKIKPSVGVPFGAKTLWRWTLADVARARKFKATQRPGPKKRQ